MTDTNAPSTIVYIGTYTGKGSEGIYRFSLDNAKAELTSEGLAAKIANPSFLAFSPDQKYLYCINEISDFRGKKSGGATSFAVDRNATELRQLDQAPSGGVGPCYISAMPDSSGVLVANYGSGDVSMIPTMPNGELEQAPAAVAHHEGKSVVPKRQEAPHAHCIMPDPTGQWALAVDLGIDQVIAYKLAKGTMDTSSPVVNKTHAGAGPRHIAFHPNGKWAYVSNELDSTITAWTWDADSGRLSEIESTTTLPADFTADNYPAEVLVHPSGKFAYLSNRGHNSVAVFGIDLASGKVTLTSTEPTRGDHPRGMTLSPDGKILIAANQNTDSLSVYRINPATGHPEFASEYKGISRPTCIVFLK